MHNHNPIESLANNNTTKCSENNTEIDSDLTMEFSKLSMTNPEQQQQQLYDSNQQLGNHENDDDDDYVLIQPAKMWTRPDIEEFKAEVSAGDGDGVITIGHGDTVTVSFGFHVQTWRMV